MDVGRRGFLSMLGMAGVGLAVPKYMVYDPERLALSNTIVPFNYLMMEFGREFKRALGNYRTEYVPVEDALVGSLLPSGRSLTNQLHVWFKLPTEEEMDWRKRCVEPGAEVLAAAMKHRGLRTLSNLPLPDDGSRATRISSKSQGIALRGVVGYDYPTDQHLMRFDLIGGH